LIIFSTPDFMFFARQSKSCQSFAWIYDLPDFVEKLEMLPLTTILQTNIL